MASNRIPVKIEDLFTLAVDAVDGAGSEEARPDLKQNTASDIEADLVAARAAQALFKTAETLLASAHSAVQVADSNIKAFLAKAKNSITSALGVAWLPVFGEAGFTPNSLALPVTQDLRFAMIQKLPAFLTAHPDCQDARPKVNVTPAAAQALYEALKAARGASNVQETAYGRIIADRDTAAEVLRVRLRGLIGELRQLLSADSPVWYAFGLNAPGDPSTPGAPLTGPFLSPGAAGTVHSVWGLARRAERYHILLQIDGTDPEPIHLATTQDRAYTFTGLPSGKTIKVSISGLNDAGEGPASPPVEMTVP
ncbi:MAG: fibronectin type III domain-containing protein [Verrucomicrobiota bacterium]